MHKLMNQTVILIRIKSVKIIFVTKIRDYLAQCFVFVFFNSQQATLFDIFITSDTFIFEIKIKNKNDERYSC